MTRVKKVLLLWNQAEEDIYEKWREAGPQKLEWDPTREAPDVGTVAEEMEAMCRAIREAGYDLTVVNIMEDLDRVISSIRLFEPDIVLNLVEYFNDDSGQEPWIAGIYELLGVPFTGNSPLTLATCQNKFRTKLILEAADLPTSPFIIARFPETLRPKKPQSAPPQADPNAPGPTESTAHSSQHHSTGAESRTPEPEAVTPAAAPTSSPEAPDHATTNPVADAQEQAPNGSEPDQLSQPERSLPQPGLTAKARESGSADQAPAVPEVHIPDWLKQAPMPWDVDNHELEFPVIVKPAAEDASGGISHDSVVHNQGALEARVRHVWAEFDMSALIEEYIDGREIHAAIIGNPGQVLPLFEMEFDDSEFITEPDEFRPQIISFRAKWDPHSKDFYTMDAVCPAENLAPEMEEHIREVALGAYKALGCTDYARIDMRIDEEDEQAYILEVNPNPDLVDGAAYMMCASASGRTYSQTLDEIIKSALKRYERSKTSGGGPLPSDQLLREFVSGTRIDASSSFKPVPSEPHELTPPAVESEVSPSEQPSTSSASTDRTGD